MPPPTPTSVIDTERFLLGACIREGVGLPGNLRPYHFEEPALAQVANAVHRLATEGKGVDELTVNAFLAEIKGVYSPHQVNSLTAEVGFSVLNPTWADAIVRASRLREITRAAENIAYKAKAGEDPDYLRVSLAEMLAEDEPPAPAAKADRAAHTREIDTFEELKAYFTAKTPERPEIHGGFAMCHWNGSKAVEKRLKDELKVTIRCIPLDAKDEPGKCVVTGEPSLRRVLMAKAY